LGNKRGGFGGLDTTNNLQPEQTSINLVELSVYGIASLYEQFSKTSNESEAKVEAPVKK
jgi:hypothetical protein